MKDGLPASEMDKITERHFKVMGERKLISDPHYAHAPRIGPELAAAFVILRRIEMVATNAAGRRREEINVPKFKALIKTPVVAPFKMPGNAILGVRKTAAWAQGAVIGTFTGSKVHTLAVSATAANVVSSIGYVERGVTVAPASGVAVMISVGWVNRQQIV